MFLDIAAEFRSTEERLDDLLNACEVLLRAYDNRDTHDLDSAMASFLEDYKLAKFKEYELLVTVERMLESLGDTQLNLDAEGYQYDLRQLVQRYRESAG